AVLMLEVMSRRLPNDAKVLSDLSAAYLVLAERNNSKEDASLALSAANRALEIDRLMPEALFNRALALQTSGMTADARIAWQAYLTIDDRSGWADEARAQLRILSNQPERLTAMQLVRRSVFVIAGLAALAATCACRPAA